MRGNGKREGGKKLQCSQWWSKMRYFSPRGLGKPPCIGAKRETSRGNQRGFAIGFGAPVEANLGCIEGEPRVERSFRSADPAGRSHLLYSPSNRPEVAGREARS